MNDFLPQYPNIESERLILRGPKASDFDAIGDFFADKDHAHGFGGPLPRDEAWRWFASNLGHWGLRGYGYLSIETKTGDYVGISGIWNPLGWPEPEVGWVVFSGNEGKGYATEAAAAVRDYAYTTLGMTTLTSNILPGNEKSKAVARRLGAWYERTYDNVNMGEDELWRHPGPEALS